MSEGSRPLAWGFGIGLIVLIGSRSLSGQSGATDEAALKAEEEASRFHITVGADVTSAYFFRGIRQEDSGFIAQPYADAAFDFHRSNDTTASLRFGAWSSFHGKETGAATSDDFTSNWYESDTYAGVGLVTGDWAFDARDIFYASPSNAFGTIAELDFSIGFDDSDLLGAWALRPSATIAFETGSNAALGGVKGAYLQLGVASGFELDLGSVKDVAVSFPITVGLSLSDYYEGTGGESDTPGFIGAGAKAAVPLGLAESWGAWTPAAGVQALFLENAASSFNGGSDFEVIGTVGISIGF